MIPTIVGVVFFITAFLAFLLGYTEGRNKGHDLEEDAFVLGYEDGEAVGWGLARETCENVSGEDWVGDREKDPQAAEMLRKLAKAQWKVDEDAFRKAHS